MSSFCSACLRWLRCEHKLSAGANCGNNDIERAVVIKPSVESNGMDIDRETYYDAELEDIPVLNRVDAARTPLLRPSNSQMLPRVRSTQTLVSYQNGRSNGSSEVKGVTGGGECLVCLEEFSVDNPQMPTLCACGDNRVFFHYPCLLIYLQDKKNCPICNRELYYQESSM